MSSKRFLSTGRWSIIGKFEESAGFIVISLSNSVMGATFFIICLFQLLFIGVKKGEIVLAR